MGRSVETLFVETVASDENCLLQRCHPFIEFQFIQSNAQLYINTRWYGSYMGKHTTYDGNFEIIVVSKIYEVSVGSFDGVWLL
jgi:hypothetical protein